MNKDLEISLSICEITVSVNRPNVPIERQRLFEWILKIILKISHL